MKICIYEDAVISHGPHSDSEYLNSRLSDPV